MTPPGYTVERLPEGALYRLGYRFVVIGPDGRSCGSYRTEEAARAAAERLNEERPEPPAGA